MRADLYNPSTGEYQDRGVYVSRLDDLDYWNEDLREEGSDLRWIASKNNPPYYCRCGAEESHECVCHYDGNE